MKGFLTVGVQLLILGLFAGACSAGTRAKHPKMSSAIVDALHSGRLQVQSDRQHLPDPRFNLTSAGLQVYIEMAEVSAATLAELRSLGVTIELADPKQRLVQARVPPAQLEIVAELSSVRFIRLPDYGVHNRRGSLDPQDDAMSRPISSAAG